MDCCSLRTASASAEVVSHIRNASISENSLFNLGRRPQYLQTNAYLSEACFCCFKVSPRRRRGERWKITANSGAPGLLMFAVYDSLIYFIFIPYVDIICLLFYHCLLCLFQLFSHVIDFQHPGCTQHRIQWVWSTQDAIVEGVFGVFEIFLAWSSSMLEERLHGFQRHFCQPLLATLLRWIAGNTSPILAGLDHFKVDYVDCEKSCDLHKYIYIDEYKSLWIHIYVLPLWRFCTCWMY